MRDPDLVLRARQAASALERAWERWRVMHGFGADPLPPVSSYVGYSLEEPWGQPRVVFGIGAEEAEKLAAILDGHDCVGPVHAEVTGRLTTAAAPEWPPPGGRLSVPTQPTPREAETEREFRDSPSEAADDDGRPVAPIRGPRTAGRPASSASGEPASAPDPGADEGKADPAGSNRPASAAGQAGDGMQAGSSAQAGSGAQAEDDGRAGDSRQAGAGERAGAGALAGGGQRAGAGALAGVSESAGADERSSQPIESELPASTGESPPLPELPPFPDDEAFAAEFAAAPVPLSDDGGAVPAVAATRSKAARPQRRKVTRTGPLQVAKRTRTRRPSAAAAEGANRPSAMGTSKPIPDAAADARAAKAVDTDP